MDAPDAPDPWATAQAQGQMNKDTAIAQYGLNATNQQTPWGSLNYSQIGKWQDGTPRYEATQTLNPKIQGVVDRALGTMSQPYDLSNDATEARLMELGNKRLQPMLDQRRGSTEQDLFNRGVRPGTEAYTRAMTGVSQGENDAYNQLLLTGHGQAVSDAAQQRAGPLNEAIALMTGGQSGYINTPGSQIAAPDYSGLVNQQYQTQAQNYQAGMSGLFGLGSAALGGWAKSDERLKTDKQKIGETSQGIGIYAYRMIDTGERQIGVMAQEVEKILPHAVMTMPDGFKAVHYPSIGA